LALAEERARGGPWGCDTAMVREHPTIIRQAIAFLDCVLLATAFYVSYLFVSQQVSLRPLTDYWIMFVGFLGFYMYFAWTRSLFSILHFSWMTSLVSRIVVIFVSAGILGAAILYAVPGTHSSRRLYFTFSFMAFVLITLEKLFLKDLFAQIRRRNRNTTPIILFGRGRGASAIGKEIRMHPEWGLRIIRKVDISVTPKEFEAVLKNAYVEEVFFSIPRSKSTGGFAVDPYLRICEEMGRPARVFMNISSATRFARWRYREFMDRPTLVSHTVELDPDQLFIKRGFDIAGALIGVVALALVYPWLALAIKLTSAGPVFFRQVRVGKNGKRFVILKLRSMYIDAEERKRELEVKNELKGAVFKMKNDPRITPLGRIMRRLSLDELPQFVNVLKGEMSLVGTRPPTPKEVEEYEKWHHRRISIKPGITGLWQVSGRSRIGDFDEIVRLDLQYIDSWSIWLDIRLILKTVLVLWRRGEAY
jgi:exopolysaccharide biosynthesis polyprenyl glycosylphosphotransferase